MANTKANKSVSVPRELENAATVRDVSALESRLDNCYTSEKYEDFQAAVEKIVWRYLKSNIAWAVLLWLISIIGSMLVEKFLHFF